jgi:biopolymer transport protein ExbB/TolQ
MWIVQKFSEGGMPYMMFLFFVNLAIIYFIIRKVIDIYIKIPEDKKNLKKGLPEILHLATFALFAGIFFQAIGLYQAMESIENLGGVSQAMLAGGLKVSFITTLYGMYIFAFSSIAWFILNRRYYMLKLN